MERVGYALASLHKMKERLPTHFMRVRRSCIVNLCR
nr:LytTR family transcriptional regulator DNA-binding domain-containing protein [uncultured Bacteroides sp.]